MFKEREEGISLVEIVVSITVLAIVLVAFFPFLMNVLKTSEINSYKAEAMVLANSQITEAQEKANSIGLTCAEISDYNADDKKTSPLVPILEGTDKVEITKTSFKNCLNNRGLSEYTVVVMTKADEKEAITVNAILEVKNEEE